MNWIYDESTEHSRVAVAIHRQGITVCRWTECDEDDGFYYQESMFSWRDYCEPLRNVELQGSGRMVARIIEKGLALLAYHGGSSDSCGIVKSLHDRYDCGFMFRF